MKATSLFAAILAVALLTVACGANHSDDTVAPVFLTVTITQGPADVDISVPADVSIGNMSIQSQAKSPTAILSPQQDVILQDWVVTPSRIDGGTTASPQWRWSYVVDVPAGGQATLQNYRIFPSDYFTQPPLNQLFPENGGVDAETGKRTIRQRLDIEIFGKTVAGRPISVKFPVTLNFYYVTP
jgi:hypothetical protein